MKVEVDVVDAVKGLPRRARLDDMELLVGNRIACDAFPGRGLQLLHDLLVGFFDSLFSPLLVHQVHQVVVAVDANLLIKVRRCCGGSRINAADLEFGRVGEGVDLGPVHGHAATSLHVGQDLGFAAFGFACLHVIAPGEATQPARTVVQDDDLLRLVVVGNVALLVDATGEVSCTATVPGAAGDEHHGQRGALEIGGMDLEHAKDDGQDVRVGAWLRSKLASCAGRSEIDQVGLYESVPEEAVIGPLPQGRGVVMLRLALEAIGEVDRVGEVHGAGSNEGLEDQEELVLVRVVDLSLAHGKKIGRDDLVDHVASEAAHRDGLGDDDDVLVCRHSVSVVSRGGGLEKNSKEHGVPRRSWMMPRMPAMLVTRDTLFAATRAPSVRRMSPVGRSMVRAGALGEEGERKVYESEATWTLTSRKGRAIVEVGVWPRSKRRRGGWESSKGNDKLMICACAAPKGKLARGLRR